MQCDRKYTVFLSTFGVFLNKTALTCSVLDRFLGAYGYQKEPNLLNELESRWDELASNIFVYSDTLPYEKRSEVAMKIRQHYSIGKPINQQNFGKLVEALGDRLFAADIGRLVQIHATTGQPTYLYQYSYRGEHSSSNYMAQNNENYGTSHGDDIMQLFIFLWNSKRPEEIKVREALIDIVFGFASTGVPKFPTGTNWLPVKPGAKELNYLEISGQDTMTMRTSADFGQKTFWDSLGFVENENYEHIRDEL